MSKRPLRVPLIYQRDGKPWCGAAATQMVLAYHGVRVPQRRIVQEMKVLSRHGVDMMKMSVFFLRHGFDAKLVCWPSQYPGSFCGKSDEELRHALRRWSLRDTVDPSRYRRSCRRLLPEFFRLGGRVEARPVMLAEIAAAVRRREPPVLNLDVAMLWNLTERYAGHYVVPIAVCKRTVTVRDPNKSYGGTLTFPRNELTFACHRWSAGALFVKPKR